MELTKKQIAAMCKAYPHISSTTIEVDAREYKTERGLIKHLTKLNAENKARHEESLPVYIKIEVQWSKNRTWGYCPTASVQWCSEDGHWHYSEKAGHASGWGYDKHSAAVADALNKCFKNLLFSIRKRKLDKAPYGLAHYDGIFPFFEGGVGMSCYPRIFNWLGYEMEHTCDAKSYDEWRIVRKNCKKRFV